MPAEIPIWMNGTIRWVSGIEKKTTCRDVIEVLLVGEGMGKEDVKDYTIMERWRRVEKPLEETSKILKVWSHWGDEKKDVRLCLKRIDTEVDSGRGSPVGVGNTPSLRRKRRSRFAGKPPWSHHETIHPKRLAELESLHTKALNDHQLRRIDNIPGLDSKRGTRGERDECRRKMVDPVYESRSSARMTDPLYESRSSARMSDPLYESRSSAYARKEDLDMRRKGCAGTGVLHSTLLPNQADDSHQAKPSTSKCCSKRPSKHKVRKSENIEKLMKLILVQGATIQSQLQKLKDREEQIESMEHERHQERLEKNGRNYLLETYLGSLGEAETPPRMDEEDEEKGNDSGVHTEGGSDQMNPTWEKEKGRLERLNSGGEEASQEGKEVHRVSRRGRLKAGYEGENTAINKQHSASGAGNLRSRSETRPESKTEEKECNNELKRTKSESLLVKSEEPADNAKDDTEEIELRRVQSQVELWEKVLKINKKLEKEEENLVRLHISIRRCQSENMKLAKDVGNQKETTSQDPVKTDLRGVEKDLEVLRSDLDNNSKEIYKNFTQLIEDDEEVENKQKYLTKLMGDLERTDQEHEVLVEMVDESKETQNQHLQHQEHLETTAFRDEVDSDIGLSIQVKGQEPEDTLLSVVSQEPTHDHTITSQREEATDMKPKTVKISFDDQIEASVSPSEKMKEPPVVPSPAGAIKSILKNKLQARENQSVTPGSISFQQLQKNTNHGSNIDCKTEKVSGPKDCKDTFRATEIVGGQIYSSPVNTKYNNPIYGENPYRYSFNGKNSFSRKSTMGLGGMASVQNLTHPSTIVTTKAVVHNDTDSSTSSDTSGLSSMYSSSPTVEETHEPHDRYVLNTLV